jgi:mono/diheme cytochrome c family protein
LHIALLAVAVVKAHAKRDVMLLDEIVDYLRTGRAVGKASASGPMAEVVANSLQYLSEADLRATAAYLKSVVPISDDSARPRDAWGEPMKPFIRGQPFDDPGQTLFMANCATCHGAAGSGRGQGPHSYPSLFHHSSVGASDPRNLITVVLRGVSRGMEDGEVFMPGFADQLDDGATATLVNYVRRQFGNGSTGVTPGEVAHLREGGAASITPLLAGVGIAAALVLLGVVAGIVFAIRRRLRSHALAA